LGGVRHVGRRRRRLQVEPLDLKSSSGVVTETHAAGWSGSADMKVSHVRGAGNHMIHVLCAAIGLLAGGMQASPADHHLEVVVEEISRSRTTATGQEIEMPRGAAEVIASVYTIPPGAALPVHKHPFPRYAYVLSGTLQVTALESGEVFTYRAGAFVIEMRDMWHRGSNPGDELARLLVIDQVEPGASNAILAPP
jgi:quercetin dioxygenase-like cupin family protein